jgi:hypothetical protein
MKKIIIYLGLFVSFVVSVIVIVAAFLTKNAAGNSAIEWGSIAASLAVITSIISILASYNIIQLQENEYRPNVVIGIDLNRTELFQIAIKNEGKVSAHNIKTKCNKPFINCNGTELFKYDREISVLYPGESLVYIVDATWQVLSTDDCIYEIEVDYFDTRKRKYHDTFILDFKKFNLVSANSDERQMAYKSVQNIEKIMKEKMR